MKALFFEHINRTLAKALTFRFIIIISDGIILYMLTHRYDITLGIMVFSNISSTLLYIMHERVWNNIHWGKHKN
jgi:uncharacterized membrane protein